MLADEPPDICLITLQLEDINVNGCPLCRQGGPINYKTFFPGTPNHYPKNITSWNNPEYLGRKGIQDDMTTVERDWINQNWGNINGEVDKNNLERHKKYIILNYNNYIFGYYNSISRDDNETFIFSNCQNLLRDGRVFHTSPPTKAIKLNTSNIQIFSLI